MENIKVVLDEVFGKSCDIGKYKEDCNLFNKFINDIKDKGLSTDLYVRGLALFVYVLLILLKLILKLII